MNGPSRLAPATPARDTGAGVAAYDWATLKTDLDGFGCAILKALLTPEECRAIAALYPDERHFRSHVHMARHG